MTIPSQFKALKKYVREGKKLSKSQPGAAYYTLLHAVQEAMTIDSKSPEANQFIGAIMDDMETIKTNPDCPSLDKAEQKIEIEALALRIFTSADEVDKRGEATKKTAQMFSTAFVLCEILKQFGERDHEIVTKGKYALMKTGTILKALRDGVQPQAGIPGEMKSKSSRESIELPDPNSFAVGPIIEEDNQMDIDSKGNASQSISAGNNESGVRDEGESINFNVPPPSNQADDMDLQPSVAPLTDKSTVPSRSAPVQPKVSTPAPLSRGVTLEELVNVCSGVEETISMVVCSLRVKDVTAAVRTIEQFIETLTPYNNGGYWKPASIPRQNREEMCAAVEVKMKHVVSALRFQDVYAALAILQHSVEALAPFCQAASHSNFI